MKITILSLFPDFFDKFITTSIIKRAIEKKLVEVEVINFRDYSTDKLKKVDYPPISGGAGMIISVEPIVNCLKAIKKDGSKVYLLSAKGKLYKQEMAKELSNYDHLILICGHYEGIDERILHYVDGEISIGDYILTGGEIGAMIVADSIIRLIPGVIKEESTINESFNNHGLLEYPQYTNPRIFDGHEVPDILYSGNHKAIDEYNFKQSIIKTLENRPELLDTSKFNKNELKIYNSIDENLNEEKAIEKAHKFMKKDSN